MRFREDTFVVPRLSHEETTLAIVTVTHSHDSYLAFLEALTAGVTEWCKSTEEGRRVYNYAGDDLNIGDLVSHTGETLDDPDLRGFLLERGIGKMRVQVHSYVDRDPNPWTYDTALVNELAMEGGDDADAS